MPFEKPVVAADGYTYDYDAIVQFFVNKPPPCTGPMRINMVNQALVPNYTLIASLGTLQHFDIAPEFQPRPQRSRPADGNNSEDGNSVWSDNDSEPHDPDDVVLPGRNVTITYNPNLGDASEPANQVV